SWDGVQGLTVEDVPPPPMVENGVRIRVGAAALNFADTLMVAGKYQVKPELPFVPGLEAGGTVIECAPGVTRVNRPPATSTRTSSRTAPSTQARSSQ
ncbi:MAG: alcohol dehydrogenase catalytic domain-containing protein, partial [Actinobacteria bacterium]|nr:alcohol dehydrogenase catalytic domain-containing protein [Actinomycetota bacterium]